MPGLKAGRTAGGVSRRSMAWIATAAFGGASTAQAEDVRLQPSPEDRFGIQDLFARYAWSFDCGDVEGVVDTFTHDGVIDAMDVEAARGHEAIRAFITKANAGRGDIDRQHCHDHPYFAREGTDWRVYSYWSVIEARPGASTGAVASLGYYVSRCVRQDGRWLFSKRSINRWNSSAVPWKTFRP